MFIKECKAISKSIIYFAFLAVVVLFYVTQLGNYAGNDIRQYSTHESTPGESLSGNPLIAPVPGQDSYGFRNEEVPEQVMPNAITKLVWEYAERPGFTSYKTGFYRSIKLSDSQRAEIGTLLMQMTGLTVNELHNRYLEKVMADNAALNETNFYDVIPVIVGYDEFKVNMEKIDKMIGGSLYFGASTLKLYGHVEITYEEKLAEYNSFLTIDKITGAYARLFCDYMGIVISLFSIFVPVSFLLRDKRAKMNELIYSRGKSSTSVVLTRYISFVCMAILPILLLSFIPTIQLSLFAIQHGISADYFAFVKYIATWLLPTALTATAVAFVFTTLTDTPIAILLQIIWSLYGFFTGAENLEGGHYGMEISIRHNSLGNLQLFQDSINALIFNRLFYTAVSIVLIIITIYLYDLKRRGRLGGLSGFKKAVRNR